MLALGFVGLWSSGYVVGSLAVQTASPLALLALRFAMALVLAIPISLHARGWREGPIRRLVLIGILLQGVQFAGIYGGLGLGVPAPLSALIMLGLTPAMTTIIARATGMERPPRRTWAMLALGIAGVALSVAPELQGAKLGGGIGLTVIGMLGLAIGTILQKRWVTDVDSRIVVTVQLATVAVVMAPTATLSGEWHLHPSIEMLWTMAWLAWPLSVGSMTLLALLLRRYAASTTSILLLLVPAATAVESAIFLGQRLAPLSLLGMAIAIVAVAGAVRGANPDQRDGEPVARRFRDRARSVVRALRPALSRRRECEAGQM
jgi:drug/metabolite transporter (DMT)-like permease